MLSGAALTLIVGAGQQGGGVVLGQTAGQQAVAVLERATVILIVQTNERRKQL